MALDRRLLRRDRPLSRRRQDPRGDCACRPGQDHGAAYLSPSHLPHIGIGRRTAGTAMRLPHILRRIAKRIVEATPIVRRHVLASSDYRMLADQEEARGIAVSSGGWLAARTVMRQERAYQGLIAAMKRGEPRLDFTVAAAGVGGNGL